MLYWILLIIILLLILISYQLEENNHEISCVISCFFTFIFGLVLVFLSIGMICEYVNIDGRIEKYKTEYDSLVYQYKNDIYDNDNDLGKKELMNDILEWNKNLTYMQNAQDNFWIGIFFADIYDQFKTIELG